MMVESYSEKLYASSTHPGDISPAQSHGVLSTIAEETEATIETLAGSPTASEVAKTLTLPTMARQETLETSPIRRAEHTAELLDILGNARAHLSKHSGKEQLDPDKGELYPIFWEQYSPHAQVELDIELESNTIIQGDCFRGHILINVKPREPLLVAIELGKIRLLGLEWLSKNDERSVFYNFSSSLLAAAPGFNSLLTSEPDEEGFSMISMGSFLIPFAFQVPTSPDYGHPKGRFSQNGVSVKTVVLVTVRVKYPVSRKQSIAHFFRECDLWPRVDPQKVLYVETRPIQVTTSEDGIHLTASLYPPTWVAGQDCRIKVIVSNNGQTPIKCVDIGLFSTITVFHTPLCQLGKDVEQMTTQLSKVALKVKQPPTPGHASAKGWWSGVKPGETRTLYQLIPIPSDVLSVSKGHLFEVTTFVRVVLPRGILLTNISVDLPLVIVNAQSFRRPQSATSHPPHAVTDLAANHTVNMNTLRHDRDNLSKSASKIQLAGSDQETQANNCSRVNEDHSTKKSLGLSLHSPNPLHLLSERVDKMPPPHLTNFSRRVEEKRRQLMKLRSLEVDEYDAELLEDLDLPYEHLASASPTRSQGESQSSSDSEDPEARTTTTTRSSSSEPDEPIHTHEHGLMAIVPEASAARSDDDSNMNTFRETPGHKQAADGESKAESMIATSPMSPKRTGNDRDAFKCAQPSMPALTPTTPKFLTSNGGTATNSLKVSSSFPSSGSVPKLGAVKERIKALEMRAAT